MAKTISIDLSLKGIQDLKQYLLDYKDNVLQQNIQKFVARLLEIGVSVSQQKVSESPLGKYVSISTNISAKKTGTTGILLAKGEVKRNEGYAPFSTILAIEFGAGIHYNPTPNPNADKFGLGVGTFPGQIHALEDYWFYWDEAEQMWKPTHGVKATMPLYEADMEIIRSIIKIAKETFH